MGIKGRGQSGSRRFRINALGKCYQRILASRKSNSAGIDTSIWKAPSAPDLAFLLMPDMNAKAIEAIGGVFTI
jgi:hypothetical protein